MSGVPPIERAPGLESDICLIVEGCYPHVTGGVSSWIDWLMRSLPEFTFSVVSVVSGNEPRRRRYEAPPNLLRSVELSLQGRRERRFLPRRPIGDDRAEELTVILSRLVRGGELGDLEELIEALDNLPRRLGHQELTQSEFAWKIICGMYRRLMPSASFIDFFWAWQSLVGGLFAVLEFPLPPARAYHCISTGYAGLLAARAAIETGRPALITEHGIYTNERRVELLMADWIVDTIDNGLAVDNRSPDIRDLWIMAFESYARVCYGACDRITTLYGDNQRLQLDLGAEQDKLQVIPNGINVDRFGAIEHEPGFPPTMALIGRVVPIKDVKTFIAAAAFASETIPGLRAYVMGPLDEDAAYAEECRQMVEELGLGDTVQFVGSVNVIEWLSRIHVVVLTSLSEAQPLVVLEAGAAGIPCVTTNVGSCREILEGRPDESPPIGDGGIVTDVVAPDQIASAVVRLLSDDRLRDEMGSNLRLRVRSYYSSERSRDAYAALYGAHKGAAGVAKWQA